MPTTDEELSKKAEQVQKLRDEVAAAEAQRVSREAEVSNDIAMAQLEVEETRLQAQFAAAKHDSKVATVKSGASSVIDTIKDEQANADAFAKAQDAARAASSPQKATESSDGDTKEV